MNKSYLHIFVSEISKHLQNIDLWTTFTSYWEWRDSLTPGRTPITDMRPWMTFQAIAFLEKNVNPSNVIFEYGGGGSTMFFLNYGASVKTVENDPKWYDLLVSIIQENNLSDRWTGYLKIPELATDESIVDFSDPNSYISSSNQFKDYIFESYVKTIDQFNNSFFDFVVIDGRARPSCIKHGVEKVKNGGYLVLDNADRDHYVTGLTDQYFANFELLLDSYGPCPYINNFIKTKIWKRVR